MSEKRYQVVSDDTAVELERNVNHMMTQGWRPTGGVMVVPEFTMDYVSQISYQTSYFYAQAMILTEKRCTHVCAFEEEVSLIFAGSAT